MSQRRARNVCEKSLRYCTNRISAEKNALSVTPARSSTVVDIPRCCAVGQRVDDEHREQRAGQAGRRDPAHLPAGAERDRDHRAERGAGRDAQRVRRGQRVAEQSLKHDAGRGERPADERGRQRAGQARDQEDLGVHVVGKRHVAAEHAAELQSASIR